MSAPLLRDGDKIYLDPPDGWDGSEPVPRIFRDTCELQNRREVLLAEYTSDKPTPSEATTEPPDSSDVDTDYD